MTTGKRRVLVLRFFGVNDFDRIIFKLLNNKTWKINVETSALCVICHGL